MHWYSVPVELVGGWTIAESCRFLRMGFSGAKLQNYLLARMSLSQSCIEMLQDCKIGSLHVDNLFQLPASVKCESASCLSGSMAQHPH